jgi:hypothetical protein
MVDNLYELIKQATDTRWWIDTGDKIVVTDLDAEGNPEHSCPPHYMPHKLPFGDKIEDEPCHIHEKKWRMLHHVPFCYMFCPHYGDMMESYRGYKDKSD